MKDYNRRHTAFLSQFFSFRQQFFLLIVLFSCFGALLFPFQRPIFCPKNCTSAHSPCFHVPLADRPLLSVLLPHPIAAQSDFKSY